MVEIYGYSIATIPAVASAVYGIIELLKRFVFCENEKFRKFIPLLAALMGAIITLIVFFVSPDLIPATSWYSSVLLGLASGLSAVGVNQIKKQAERKDGKDADT